VGEEETWDVIYICAQMIGAQPTGPRQWDYFQESQMNRAIFNFCWTLIEEKLNR
jgi:hypothetical protein